VKSELSVTAPARCENIGPRQRALRVRLAIACFVLGDALSLTLLVTHAAQGWRLTVFVPFLLAAICLLEAVQRTCILLAARGLRDMDDGTKPVTDPALARQSVVQSWRLVAIACVVALVLTLALWLA